MIRCQARVMVSNPETFHLFASLFKAAAGSIVRVRGVELFQGQIASRSSCFRAGVAQLVEQLICNQ